MRIVVFDDRRSLAHLGLGILSVMWPWIWIVFTIYEVVEFCYRWRKKRREKIGEFIGAVSYTHLTLPTNREV